MPDKFDGTAIAKSVNKVLAGIGGTVANAYMPGSGSLIQSASSGVDELIDQVGSGEKKKEPIKPRAAARITPVVEKPKPPPKAKSVVAPPKKPTESDPNAGLVGVALGAAPLVLVPFVALSAGRDFLTKTAARRAEIEAEIAAAEAAKAKKARDAQVDSAGLAKAGVSGAYMV